MSARPAGSSLSATSRQQVPSSHSRCAARHQSLLRSVGTCNSMSNHHMLKPANSLGDTSDYRIQAPNVTLNEVPECLKKDCLLFYYPDCEQLARRIVQCSDGTVELAEINWKRFADGFPNLFVKDAIRIRNRHVAFLASFHTPGVIFEQISIIYQLPRLFVGSFTLVLPYFPTGTAERVEAEGDVATAFTLARIISNIPLARGGPASVVIFDIHALQERFYFGDQVLPLFESGIPLLRQRLQQLPDASNITIAYPDEGAWKRFHYQFGDYPEVICTKVRDGDKRIVRLKEGTPRGRHVVIVDDLVQSGGTLIECQRLLSTQGAAHVSAYVTHGVFPNESWRRFEGEGGNGAADGFKYFWITDSCPATVTSVTDRAPFEVLSLAAPIAAALQI
ncbi:Ribose-phosphate pyrophosphokinase 3 [Chlorella vulgaris]